MKVDDLFEQSMGLIQPPLKWHDVKLWVRLAADGLPQIIRVEPVTDDFGNLIPENVVLTIDEAPPQIMDRGAASMMLSTPNCVPLEQMLQWKHRIRH